MHFSSNSEHREMKELCEYFMIENFNIWSTSLLSLNDISF